MSSREMVSVKGIKKTFAMADGSPLQVLRGVSMDIHESEFICILGYSGCGKSTLLRIIAALEKPDDGEVYINGHNHTAPGKDAVMLFQDFNQLFSWKTVIKNVMYPMLATGLASTKTEARAKATDLLDSVGLTDFKRSYPHQLSGGMKQRAAVARALSLRPKVLLMDEPFAALDAVTRVHLQNLTRQVCREHGVTVLFVTHNVEEAVIMADRIVLLSSLKGGVDRIIENNANKGHDKQARMGLITDILSILDNQLAEM